MSKIFWGITKQNPITYGVFYLILIPLFAIIYVLFPGVEIKCASGPCGVAQSVYYSVVTITTLGYGDVLPATTLTQLFAACEVLLGVIAIGLFLNSLSNRLAQEYQEVEKEKEEESKRYANVARFRNHDSLIQLNINRYLLYTAPITITRDNRYNTSEIPTANPGFIFSDMQDLFKPTDFQTDNYYKPAVSYYFDAQNDLINAVKDLVKGVELYRWPQLESLCLQFINDCKTFDPSEHILGQSNVTIGDEKATDYDARLIKNHTGPIEYKFSNSINPYVSLYFLLKKNLAFVQAYKEESAKVLSAGK